MVYYRCCGRLADTLAKLVIGIDTYDFTANLYKDPSIG